MQPSSYSEDLMQYQQLILCKHCSELNTTQCSITSIDNRKSNYLPMLFFYLFALSVMLTTVAIVQKLLLVTVKQMQYYALWSFWTFALETANRVPTRCAVWQITVVDTLFTFINICTLSFIFYCRCIPVNFTFVSLLQKNIDEKHRINYQKWYHHVMLTIMVATS